jgi:hypothetical protein
MTSQRSNQYASLWAKMPNPTWSVCAGLEVLGDSKARALFQNVMSLLKLTDVTEQRTVSFFGVKE